MSLTDEFDASSPAGPRGHQRASSQKSRVAWALVLVLILAVPALFFAGHPFVATWVALVALGWLFIIGAARASGD